MRPRTMHVVDSPKAASIKGAKRASSIVQKGAEILLQQGLRAVNKRKIASALGISDGNVSYYFPTRDSLWAAVLDHELEDYFLRFHSTFLGNEHSPQARLDDYIEKWVDEYQDRMVRVFFSQILTFGETEPLIAQFRDKVYRIFFGHLFDFSSALDPTADPGEMHKRVLVAMSLLEGLHAVTAFRPDTIQGENGLKDSVLEQVNRIIKGPSTT
jgi:AcrR family transcriptional regulator